MPSGGRSGYDRASMSLIDVTSSASEGDLAGSTRRIPPAAPAASSYSWVRRRLGAWDWSTRSEWARLIHSNNAPDWSDLGSWPSATLVKANDGRQVWRLEMGGELFFAKLYAPPRGWAWLRRRLLGSDSARERRVAEYARRHGICTVQPVASADATDGRCEPASILITEGLPHALPLNELWSSLEPTDPRTRQTKNIIADRVGRLIAHAHQNGFEHTDLHAGNILINRVPGGDYQALFVDLHNIRVGRPVSDRAVIRNLAQFHQWFRSRAPLTDRLRFLDRYLHWRRAYETSGAFGRRMSSDTDELRLAIEKTATAHANALYAKRDRRSTRSGRYFTRLRLGNGWRGHAYLKCKYPVPGSVASTMTFQAAQWREWLQDPSRWTGTEQSRYAIKQSASGTVCRSRLPPENAELDVICKRSMPRHLGKRIKNCFRQSRALRTWRLANALLNRQVPTARPLAVLERRRAGILLDSLIITEYLEHAHDLDTLLTVKLRELDPERQRRLKLQVIDALAAAFRALHSRGFIHRDLKAPNVMVQWNPDSSEPPRVLFVDLDGVRQVRRVRDRAWIRAMMRLNISLDHCRRVTRTDRLRFLLACLVRPGNPQPEWRPIWRRIAQLSEQKRRRKNLQFEKMMAKYGRI